MFSGWVVISFTFGYLALLFAIAFNAEKAAGRGKSVSNNAYIYSLSLAVYCTAWTYYGSVGRAAVYGLEFLTIYIGPSLLAPLWWMVMRKIIRICKVQNITSIADFISSRYGKNITLGGVVTIFCLLGILPYIALQIKALGTSFDILRVQDSASLAAYLPFYQDTAFYLSLGLALFTILFGTRNIEATARHEGMVSAVAFESFFKLIAFIAVGVFVTYFVFEDLEDIFSQISKREMSHLFVLDEANGYSEWFWMSGLSMLAFLFLPRQFQLGVIENTDEKHLDKAIWLFPLYLLLINVFVLPIAMGGLIHFDAVEADTFVLAFPIAFDQGWLAVLVYLGGFSAATSMIIVSAIALSTMVSNNLLMPVLLVQPGFQKKYQHKMGGILIWARRFTILAIILLAYLYYRNVAADFSLVSIGLISFVAIAQFSPSILGGIYWKKGSKVAALSGILTGFCIWLYTLVVPTIIVAGYLPESIHTEGLFGLSFLRPYALFGFEDMSYISHGLFFSLSANTLVYVLVSMFSEQTSKEHNQAVVFVDIFKYSTTLDSSIIWKGTAYLPNLKTLLINFLGKEKTELALLAYSKQREKDIYSSHHAAPELVNFSERLLSGVIGSASARIMVSSVVKEEEISMEEVMDILRETQQLKSLNTALIEKTEALRIASEKLREMNQTLQLNDMLKDEFISTVAHEMKTPITSIRAFSEILLEEKLDEEQKWKFLNIIIKETQRMGRLIDQVLDLERFDSGKQQLHIAQIDLNLLLKETFYSMEQLFKEKGLQYSLLLDDKAGTVPLDEDRIKQVVLNLLSNASKFAASFIQLQSIMESDHVRIEVSDDGKGVEEEEKELIFDKFYQAKNQTSKKPVGSGLGLAISKRIVEHHGGKIKWSRQNNLTCFQFSLPLNRTFEHNLKREL